MADVDDEFEREFGGAAAAPADVDEFEAEFPVAVQEAAAQPAPAPAPRPEPTGMDYLLELARNGLLGLGEGASLGHGSELAGIGSKIGSGIASLVHPEIAARAGGEDIGGELMDEALASTAGKVGQGLGTVATAVGSAGLGGATKGGQALAGAIQGGVDAHGRGESVLGGAALGGALGLAGGALGQQAAKLAGPAVRMGIPSTGTRAGQIAEQLGGLIPGKGVYGEVAKRALEPGLEALAGLARGAGQLGASFAGRGGDEADALLSSRAKADVGSPGRDYSAAPEGPTDWSVDIGDAQIREPEWKIDIGQAEMRDPRAWKIDIGDAEIRGPHSTQEWAVQSVLYQGNSGLPPDAERRLTEAVMSGDADKLATQSFLLSGKYPRFADALQRQRDSLTRNEED